MLLLVFAGAAQAHRVNIFAWLEGETVRVECSFRRDSPVRQGTVIVFDAQTGTELLQGRTDGQGAFAFPVPAVVRQGTDCVSASWPGKGIRTSGRWMLLNFPVCCLLPGRGRRCRWRKTGQGPLQPDRPRMAGAERLLRPA